MRVIVCGSRTFSFREWMFRELDKIHEATPITCVIEGEATGADSLGKLWAKSHGIEVLKFRADWKQYGKTAGLIRNREMLLADPDKVYAFVDKPLQESRGTAHMVKISAQAGVPTRVFEYAG